MLLRLRTFTGILPILKTPLLTIAPNSIGLFAGSHSYSVIWKPCEQTRERELGGNLTVCRELTFDRKTASSRSAIFCPRHFEVPEPKFSSRTLIIFSRYPGGMSSSPCPVIHRDGSCSSGSAPNTSASLIVAPKHMLYSHLATVSLEVEKEGDPPYVSTAWNLILRIAFRQRELFSEFERWRTDP